MSRSWLAGYVAPRVVFFDWGGTLAFRPAHLSDPAVIWVKVARELGVAELSEEETRAKMEAIDPLWQERMYSYLGRSEEFWHAYNVAVMDTLGIVARRDDVDRQVTALSEDPGAWQLYPEVHEVLEALRGRGLRLGVISNSSERLVQVVRHCGLDRELDPVVVTQEVGAQKPDARVFQFALRRAGCRANEAVHVGDTFEADYLGATRAGLRGVWLNRKGRPAPGACEEVADLRKFAKLL